MMLVTRQVGHFLDLHLCGSEQARGILQAALRQQIADMDSGLLLEQALQVSRTQSHRPRQFTYRLRLAAFNSLQHAPQSPFPDQQKQRPRTHHRTLDQVSIRWCSSFSFHSVQPDSTVCRHDGGSFTVVDCLLTSGPGRAWCPLRSILVFQLTLNFVPSAGAWRDSQ